MRLGVVLLGFGLIGCGSTAREQIAVVGRNADAAMGEFGECRASIHANPAYADLVARTATRADAPDSDKYRDRSVVHPTQRQAAVAFFGEMERCRRLVPARMGYNVPVMWRLHDEAFAAYRPVWSGLADGRTTWGETNRRRMLILANYQNRAAFELNREIARLDVAARGEEGYYR
jgi:hypothetical protein